MISELFLLFMIIHILGDYYLQNEILSTEKNSKLKKVLIHGSIYLIISQILIIPIWSTKIVFYAVIFSIMHLLVDLYKVWYLYNCKQKKS